LASVIGEDELSPNDKKILAFGRDFENIFLNQGEDENRSLEETLDLGWQLLSKLPRNMLDRTEKEMLDKYYEKAKSVS